MTDTDLSVLKGRQRGNWIRLRTIILLRWVAIAGQLAALAVSQQVYNLALPLVPCLMVVGASVIGNLLSLFLFPENKRLSETENLMMVLFDLLQLGLLLYLTGGLHNPFSILVIGPVMVSASALSLRSTVFLGLTAILVVSVLAQFHLPLRTEQGFILRIPDIFLFGSWAAIVIAVIFLSVYARRVAVEMHAMSDALQATQLALAREQKLTDLGGVVAAAAHELGTPLATIKLTSAELIEDLADRPELRDDATLIRDQADRCRDILRSMGRAGKDDLHLRTAPLSSLIEEAAEPHKDRGKRIRFPQSGPDGEHDAGAGWPPTVVRRPEIIHGLRNLIQNAVDFAAANVWIESQWSPEHVVLRIVDDGPGFPADLIGRIGDPFVRRRPAPTGRLSQRPGYEGMGLGLFIAKTLLERSGATLSFANGYDPAQPRSDQPEKCGAIVEVTWPRRTIEATRAQVAPREPNRPITP
ncbi:sensor histidine kinase RegB [Sediminimonas sp.]|uniref:sensor histidine kinase RegB n=1 Tax=Sediminimonas sp. TaxID=2823379 RepID=UPI0025F04829|nr:ActS/PrrB/RegB family redox-sensitive histidine kinase [Sediminimonas sp.]